MVQEHSPARDEGGENESNHEFAHDFKFPKANKSIMNELGNVLHHGIITCKKLLFSNTKESILCVGDKH